MVTQKKGSRFESIHFDHIDGIYLMAAHRLASWARTSVFGNVHGSTCWDDAVSSFGSEQDSDFFNSPELGRIEISKSVSAVQEDLAVDIGKFLRLALTP